MDPSKYSDTSFVKIVAPTRKKRTKNQIITLKLLRSKEIKNMLFALA